jgi:hypothetical protein
MINPFWYSSPPPGGDPYWEDVVLLLHCDGTNGSTTFTDNSNSAHTATAGGNTQITTTDPKFGTGSALFDGNADFIDLADSDDWHFGTGDFTIEMWLFPATVSGTQALLGQRLGPTYCPFAIAREGSSLSVILSFNNASWAAVPTISGGTLVANTWHHVALTRNGSSFKLWLDGSQVGSTYTSASSFTDIAQVLRFGGIASFWYNGKMDDIRITKGVARYTSNFTPPTAAFPDS